ncbi:Gfo/Idh/MocA family oxidoreductase [Novosphingobium sp. G106]|uniref:Gfo/Idh/MocA family protein n=1 Tax=Novosphingobium sp. G106 TaxID=2849500 RepID=UPI001C2D76A0|nr:Gfo/Idh/MocA family oxidoreductase [Novosphingobium sp. G106]MBV1686153.1 Gfo/Idh/MocA family oxidoreductase [Novosphingobium sp. G106]
MTGAPLRIGFAGANAERGWARDAHIPALKALPGLVIHAVSARTREIADQAASAFGAARAYDNSLDLARDPEIDVVAVTVKVPEHRAIVLAALQAGKHVYCEWPLARDTAEAEELAEAAHKAGVHVAIGLQGANSLAVRHASRLVHEGAIGRPLNLRVVSATAGWGAIAPPHYAYLQDRRNGATLATIAGGHTLAMAAAVIGPFVEVGACNSILRDRVEIAGTGELVERTCADHLLIHGRHAGGCVSSIEIVSGDGMPLRFELQGTEGKLEITGRHPGGYQCAALTVTGPPGSEPQPSSDLQGLEGAAINVAELYRRFEQDIRSGNRTVADFDMAVKLHRLLDAIEVASGEGHNVRPYDIETER